MFVSRSNKETLKWLKEIKWREMSEENLTREADSFFGVLKTKRIETAKVKIADFVKKEDNMRQKIRFQIMKSQKCEGPRGIYMWVFPHMFGFFHTCLVKPTSTQRAAMWLLPHWCVLLHTCVEITTYVSENPTERCWDFSTHVW